jgi:predicted RNase H-like HicB family nuclease
MSSKRIVVEKRSNDYMAYLEGNKTIWAAGKTIYEAIGDLILHHAEHFDLEVKLEF